MNDQNKQEAYALIQRAKVRRHLITKLKKADLIHDPNWQVFTREMSWYTRKRKMGRG